MGGLGNQMFQYALGRRVSLLRKTELKVDVSFLNDLSYSHTSRKLELDVFFDDISIATEAELAKFKNIQESKFKKGIQRLFPFVFPYHTIGERLKQYDESIINSPKNSLLIGYWQTEKYFLQMQEVIRKDFTFKKRLEGLNRALAENISSCNSVSMHIRRGDYVHNSETSKFHGVCSPEYYYEALEFIEKKSANIQLYVFSDDMEWVKVNMKFDVPVTYVDNNTGNQSYIDMQLMSLCKHNIIANSSFSWWGAWLNNNPDKIVVAPSKWVNDATINVTDIIPVGWQKI